MSVNLLHNASYTFEPAHPWVLNFSGAKGIEMPFWGTAIFPVQNNEAPNFHIMDMNSWLYTSLRFPEQRTEDNQTRYYLPSLRSYANKPFFLTHNRFIILCANDHNILEELDWSNLFTDIGNFHNEKFGENAKQSAYPRYILLELEQMPSLPQDGLIPISRSQGDKLQDEDALKQLWNNLDLSGKIWMFDFAGQQIESYSGLKMLGITASVQNSPASNKTCIQFVDLHGTPIAPGAFPLQNIVLSPSLSTSDFEEHKYFHLALGSNNTINFTVQQDPASHGYLYDFLYVGFWPGFGQKMKKIKPSGGLSLDLTIDAQTDMPHFIRLMLFHPSMDFQTEIGGNIAYQENQNYPSQAIFQDNKLQVFSEDNKIAVYNDGASFFADYHKVVKGLKADDKLYQTNWKTWSHLMLEGRETARNIEPLNVGPDEIDLEIQKWMDNSISIPVQVHNENHDKFEIEKSFICVRIARLRDDKEKFLHTFSFLNKDAQGSAFNIIRKDNLAAVWLKHGKDHEIIAVWKNQLGNVIRTERSPIRADDSITSPGDPTTFTAFPDGLIELTITDEPLPKANIRRLKTVTQISDDLTASVATPSNLQLLVQNITSGTTHIIPLIPNGSTGNESNIDLIEQGQGDDSYQEAFRQDVFANDQLAIAFIESSPDANFDLSTDRRSDFREFRYKIDEIASGNIPLHLTEVGGLYRDRISNDVELKAVYWDQFLTKMHDDANAAKGFTNNTQLTEIINSTVSGTKRGYSLRDRSMRAFGSFHQKSTYIQKEHTEFPLSMQDPVWKLISYLGGINLAKGRYDTENHPTYEPDRQGGRWYDQQVKVEGMAALDILWNFKHRWEAMYQFKQGVDMEEAIPVNLSSAIEQEMSTPLKIPNPDNTLDNELQFSTSSDAFVQITRTIPPFSHHANPQVESALGINVGQDGELGSYAAFRKAIQNSKKYIFLNDQYFFNQEIALDMHNALKSDDGPSFLVLVLPKELGESPYIDPLLFVQRKKAINTLYYGSNYQSQPLDKPICGDIIPNTPQNATHNVKNKVAILTPVNREEKAVYVHSKHLIVDDVWMFIGSSNSNLRSMTYDYEINASIIGRKTYKGGTDQVRNQRIELFRKLLGVPNAYFALLNDPYASFKLFKAVESEGSGGDRPNLHPLEPMVRKLDPSYIPPTGNAAYDDEMEIIGQLDPNSEDFNFVICGVLDPDGRSKESEHLYYLAEIMGLGHFARLAFLNLAFTTTQVSEGEIKNLINTDPSIPVNLKLFANNFETDTNGNDVELPAKLIKEVELEIASNTQDVRIKIHPNNKLSVPVSSEAKVRFTMSIFKNDVDRNITGNIIFDPSSLPDPIKYGDTLEESILVE